MWFSRVPHVVKKYTLAVVLVTLWGKNEKALLFRPATSLGVVFKSCLRGRKHISIGHTLDENNNKVPGIKSSSDNDHNASNSYKKKNWSPKEYQN